MKISYRWLREFVDLETAGVNPQSLAECLTLLGLTVEGVETANGDDVFTLDVTTNRPDCLSHLGVAREVAARFGLTLRRPDSLEPPARAEGSSLPARVDIEDPELCPRYAARVIDGVRIGESPAWLKETLERVGQRPINNVVDVTNYVLLEIGHPLHAFDYGKLEEHRIVVRRARDGEVLRTLDGVTRTLDGSMLMICDARRPVALGGIMGGEETEVSGRTRTLLLESAYFLPASVRNTSKVLGIRTEASARFERGADPEMPVKALNRACRLIEEVAGGCCVGPVLDERPLRLEPVELELRLARIRRLLGVSPEAAFVRNVLERLEFEILKEKPDGWLLRVPSFRPDATLEEDLVEEVARHYGYDRIEGTYPPARRPASYLPWRPQEILLTEILSGLGFFEACNYVFRSPRREEPFWNQPPRLVQLSNPLTAEDTHLRLSLLPGLVESVRRNVNHGSRDVRLFEIGSVYLPGSTSDPGDYQEIPRLGLIATGVCYSPFWNTARDEFHFFHLKGVVQLLFDRLRLPVEFRRLAESPSLHPGAAAEVLMDGERVGMVGELHPRLLETYKFLQKVLVAEVDLRNVFERSLAEPSLTELARFPAVERDLSFVVDRSLEFVKIHHAIRNLGIDALRAVQILDLYQGLKLPANKVSLTIRLTFADPFRTLTQEEVSQSTERIFSLVESSFGAERRS